MTDITDGTATFKVRIKGGGNFKDILDKINKIEHDRYYHVGDTIDGVITTCGYLTGGNTSIQMCVPLNKPIGDDVSGATLGTSAIVTIRQDGYLGSTTADNKTTLKSLNCVPTVIIKDTSLTISLAFSDKIGGTNNSPVGIYLNGTITFS